MNILFSVLVLSVVTLSSSAAQEQPPVPPPTPPPSAPPATQPPAGTPPGAVTAGEQPPPAKAPLPSVAGTTPLVSSVAQPLDAETMRRRRDQISIMEGVLARAVRNAAQQIATEMQTPETGPFLLSGSLGARGFILDGYGVFFHVEIPGVQPSLISPAVLQALQERLGRARPAQPEAASTSTVSPYSNQPGNAVYVERVKDALVKAMIEYSKPLELRPDEWFTVAAGDGDEPLMPAVLAEQSMMVLRIRGGDIAEYMAGRLTLDDVRKKVEVRKF